MSTIAEKLEQSRKELLDLSLRNNLLNFRPLKSKGIEVVDEISAEVFRHLVTNERPMSFLPLEVESEQEPTDEVDKALAALIEESQEEESRGPQARHRDEKLQTGYSPLQLEKRLKNTFSEARISIEELGVNTLYLALGSLIWFEAESSELPRRAPLILVPAELSRTNIRERFALRFNGDEIGENLSLREKLKIEFGIVFPEFPQEVEELDVAGYFSSIREAAANQPRWTVEPDRISLGFCSFAKFLMFKDLAPDSWPSESRPHDHRIICALLGDGFAPDPSSEADEEVDRFQQPPESFQVVDADSSQTKAMMAVGLGRDLVIQGPPGTGKSQTITNLIADCLGRGKKVLFVAEKLAALEVVKRRLDSVGLGDAALELHSQKSNKKAVLEELKRIWRLGKPKLEDVEGDLIALRASREQLNAYAKAVNSPVGDTKVTPRRAYGRLLQYRELLRSSKPPVMNQAQFRNWDAGRYRVVREIVHGLQSLLQSMGIPARHPFWGCGLELYIPTRESEYKGLVESARARLESVRGGAEKLGGLLSPDFSSPAELGKGVAGAHRLLCAPAGKGVRWSTSAWHDSMGELTRTLGTGKRLAQLHNDHAQELIESAWDAEVLPLRGPIAAHGRKWWRWLLSSYRQARANLHGLCRTGAPSSGERQLELVDAILEWRKTSDVFKSGESKLREVFEIGTIPETPWDAYLSAAEWIAETQRQTQAGAIPAGLPELLDKGIDRNALKTVADAVERDSHDLGAAVSDLFEEFKFSESLVFPQGGWRGGSFKRLDGLFEAWLRNLPKLHEITRWNAFLKRLSAEGLDFPSVAVGAWEDGPGLLTLWLDDAWHTSILETAFEQSPALGTFHGDTHEETLRRFRRLDQAILAHNRHHLAKIHWDNLPKTLAGGGQSRVLAREFEKRRRHLPLRQLMASAGEVVQALKPVFMMSPLSIARFIPPQSITFDTVIFDEASQVQPVDSFGAILRCNQAVVVGDSKQLPPTRFFERTGDEETEETETSVLESILGMFCSTGATERMLRWHYRSRHDSLIKVSNHEFYENRLRVFPSPDRQTPGVGLEFVHLPHTHYEPGSSRRYNVEEAKHVARAVMEHAEERPDQTLGVAAFSQAQARMVEDQLEILRRKDTRFEDFFLAGSAEPFFIKNLENVQGDERDVIFISMGYGKTKEGFMSMSFGPVNWDGGERRLNVLITRARLRCVVFSNFRADDIDLSRTQARGVKALKAYLMFADKRILDIPAAEQADSDSPFEDHVYEKLCLHGYKIDRQVGTGGFFIDLAVVDPDKPGRYLIGIECDGAAYHSSKSARDRDRLREQVLRRLGWTLHRIWSTDWFRDQDRELAKVVRAIEAAKQRAGSPPSPVQPLSNPGIQRSGETRDGGSVEAKPYQVCELNIHAVCQALSRRGQQLHETPYWKIAEWVQRVVEVEGPLPMEEVARRIATGAGLNRSGSRIRGAVRAAADFAASRYWIAVKDGFLWDPKKASAPPRDRSDPNLPFGVRKIESVAPEEIGAALTLVVEQAFLIDRSEAVSVAARVLGFQRTGKEVASRIDQVVDSMIQKGAFGREGSQLRLVKSQTQTSGDAEAQK